MTFVGPLMIVYVVWGSTYLGLKVGLEGFPPLTLNAVRFLVAGALLFAYCAYRRWPLPDRPQWRAGAIQGLLLPAAGTGGACWAEQSLSSGTTALYLATIPLWIVIGRRFADRERITAPVGLGLAAGIAGVAVLVEPGGGGDAVATAVALVAAACWGLGSVYALHAPRPARALMASAIEMLSAGAILAVLAAGSGELGRVAPTGRSLLALGYLIVFGSLVAYTAYTWLLDHVAPRIAGTYAFVNPIVAVLLGWWLLDEHLGVRVLAATAVIAAGVALIVLAPARTTAEAGSRGLISCLVGMASAPAATRRRWSCTAMTCCPRFSGVPGCAAATTPGGCCRPSWPPCGSTSTKRCSSGWPGNCRPRPRSRPPSGSPPARPPAGAAG
jgi:drug/metabolite transporter (DMT)-like permease